MAFGLDYVTAPSIEAMKTHDPPVTFVCRYLSAVNDLTKIKLLTPAEAKADSEAGIAIVSNYEWYEKRPLEGYASGVSDAKIGRDQHAACGGPATRPIYFSVDFDATGQDVAMYFRGIADTIGLVRTGAYGSERVLKYLFDNNLISWGWQPFAWSNGLWEPRAHIRQVQNGVDLDDHKVDFDQSMKPDFGQWFYGGITPMQQYTKDSADFAQWFEHQDDNHWLCKNNNVVIHDAILHFYQKLSIDGQHLPVVGLPRTSEIYIKVNDATVVFVVCERAVLCYDPAHSKGIQPGTDGTCQLLFLTDPDVLKNVPGLTLPPTAHDITALLAAINAIPDAIAQAAGTATAAAILEAKKLSAS